MAARASDIDVIYVERLRVSRPGAAGRCSTPIAWAWPTVARSHRGLPPRARRRWRRRRCSWSWRERGRTFRDWDRREETLIATAASRDATRLAVRILPPDAVVTPRRRADACASRVAAPARAVSHAITERLDHWAERAPDRTFLAARDDGRARGERLTYATALERTSGASRRR